MIVCSPTVDGETVKLSFLHLLIIGWCVACASGIAYAADCQTPASTTGEISKPSAQVVAPTSHSSEQEGWFKTFQDGNILSKGWREISAEIMTDLPPEQRSSQKVLLDDLGRKIGMEWSRPNSVRRINSRMLIHWGDELRKVAHQNPGQLAATIACINREVDSILD